MIGVIETGNSANVHNALHRIGHQSEPYDSQREYAAVVIPGVGHFAYCMDVLRDGRIDLARLRHSKLLGICVGGQVFYDSSEEAPLGPSGLGWIAGCVTRVVGQAPRVGWYAVEGQMYYFTHSYEIPRPIVRCGNLTAVQFHPEKSGAAGMRFLSEWASD